jgi:hypothetical protein
MRNRPVRANQSNHITQALFAPRQTFGGYTDTFFSTISASSAVLDAAHPDAAFACDASNQ